MVTSLAIHVLVVAVLMLIPAQALLRSEPPKGKELDIVFYRPPEIAVTRARGFAGPVPEERLRPVPQQGRLHPRETETERPCRSRHAWQTAELPPGPAEGFPV